MDLFALVSFLRKHPTQRRGRPAAAPARRAQLDVETLETRTLLSASLVAAYGFNEGQGTVLTDSSGNGNNGTISGATWSSTAKFGKSLLFNGSSMVTVPDAASLHLTTGMTLEAWVRPTALSN